jgi:hypothetical protein
MTQEQIESFIAQTYLKRWVTEDEIADTFIFLAKNDAMTGQVIYVDAGFGPNFTTYMGIVAKDKISFKEKDLSFLNSTLVRMLVDYSETISPNATRGRLDPFVPYASSRPLR